MISESIYVKRRSWYITNVNYLFPNYTLSSRNIVTSANSRLLSFAIDTITFHYRNKAQRYTFPQESTSLEDLPKEAYPFINPLSLSLLLLPSHPTILPSLLSHVLTRHLSINNKQRHNRTLIFSIPHFPSIPYDSL